MANFGATTWNQPGPYQGWVIPGPPAPAAAPAPPAPAVVQAPPARVDSGWGWLNPMNWNWGATQPQNWVAAEGAIPLPAPPTSSAPQGFRDAPEVPANPAWTLDQIPKWNAPDEQKAALAAAGMNYGQAAPPQQEPLSLVDMSKATTLTEHTYNISDRDWSAIQRSNGQWVDPVKNPAPEVRGGWDQSAPMTQAAYDALSDDQRRAIDFNTLLVDARETDLKTQQALTGADLEQYNKDVAGIFGEGGGSSVVAPATVAMLKGLGMQLQGQDLDDFLSGEAAVQLNELLEFQLPQTPNMILKPTGQTGANQDLADFSFTRSDENRDRVTAVAIRKAGELIDKALKRQDIQQPDWVGTVWQGLGVAKDRPAGWNGERDKADPLYQQEQFYQGAYNYLRNPQNVNLDGFWASVKNAGLNEQEIDDLFKYVDQRADWEKRTGFQGGGARVGDDVRTFAGLGGAANGQG